MFKLKIIKGLLCSNVLACLLILPLWAAGCVKFNQPKIVIPEQIYDLELTRENTSVTQVISFAQKVDGSKINLKTIPLEGFLWQIGNQDVQNQVEFTFTVEPNTLLNLADNLLKQVIISYNNLEWWININLNCGKQNINLLNQNAGDIEVQNPSKLITAEKAVYILWYANRIDNDYWQAAYSEINLFKEDTTSEYEILLREFDFTEIQLTSVLVTAQNTNVFFKKNMLLNFTLVTAQDN